MIYHHRGPCSIVQLQDCFKCFWYFTIYSKYALRLSMILFAFNWDVVWLVRVSKAFSSGYVDLILLLHITNFNYTVTCSREYSFFFSSWLNYTYHYKKSITHKSCIICDSAYFLLINSVCDSFTLEKNAERIKWIEFGIHVPDKHSHSKHDGWDIYGLAADTKNNNQCIICTKTVLDCWCCVYCIIYTKFHNCHSRWNITLYWQQILMISSCCFEITSVLSVTLKTGLLCLINDNMSI